MSRYTCHKCKDDFDEDDVAWADSDGQVHDKGVNGFPYCVPCLPPQATARGLARRAREQRNATTTNEEFDYWHNIMVHYENKLKTGDRQ